MAAFAALGVDALGLVAVIVRAAMRRWRGMSFAANLVMVVVLAFVGTGGLVANQPIRELQARHDVAIGDWSDALTQYALIESDPSCRRDCRASLAASEAYADYEYGLLLGGERNYKAAVDRFSASLAASSHGHYATAARGNLAEVQYLYGLQLVGKEQYLEAITQLQTAYDDLPQGPYASKAHSAIASAYYSLAEQELSGPACVHAVSLLQIITELYGDRPEAAQAKAKLATPTTVSGEIENYPTDGSLEVWLSKSASIPPYNQTGPFHFSEDYKTLLDPHTGQYTFHNVVPGLYTVSTYDEISGEYYWWYSGFSDLSAYYMTVGPVCPFAWYPLNCNTYCK